MITCKFEDGNPAKLRHITVDVMLLKGDEILLVKRAAQLSEGGKWGLTGGYMERDETIAQAAARETHEESGYEITKLTLLFINDNPDRPFEDRQNVSFVYFAEAGEKTGEPDWESEETKWFKLDDLPPREQIAFDHADDIDAYKKYLIEKPTLPLI